MTLDPPHRTRAYTAHASIGGARGSRHGAPDLALLQGMLQAIAYGANEPNQIAQRVNRPVTALSGALGFLVDYGLLERRSPFTVANPQRTRQTRYYIADNYLSFWFRFVLPNRSALEQGQAQYVWQSRIA